LKGGELVPAADGDALAELAAGDGAGGVGELLEGADDRPAEQPSEESDDCQRREGEEEEALA
jgi:hypothetical protein